MPFDKDMMRALEADGEKLRQITGEDHGPVFLRDVDPDSAAGRHGMEIATFAMRAVYALQEADWINPDVDNEDLSDACQIIADIITEAVASAKPST